MTYGLSFMTSTKKLTKPSPPYPHNPRASKIWESVHYFVDAGCPHCGICHPFPTPKPTSTQKILCLDCILVPFFTKSSIYKTAFQVLLGQTLGGKKFCGFYLFCKIKPPITNVNNIYKKLITFVNLDSFF